MTTIAILDDGISSSRIPTLGKIERWIAVAEDGAISQGDEPDKMTHGTLCAAIICSYAPDAKLISVKVLDPTTLKGSINQIRYALEWCIAQNVSLINLSIGSTSFKDWKLLQPNRGRKPFPYPGRNLLFQPPLVWLANEIKKTRQSLKASQRTGN